MARQGPFTLPLWVFLYHGSFAKPKGRTSGTRCLYGICPELRVASQMPAETRRSGGIFTVKPESQAPRVCRAACRPTRSHRLGRAHEIVTFRVEGDFVHCLAGVLGQEFVQATADLEDLLRLDVDVTGLALEAARG